MLVAAGSFFGGCWFVGLLVCELLVLVISKIHVAADSQLSFFFLQLWPRLLSDDDDQQQPVERVYMPESNASAISFLAASNSTQETHI